MPDGIRLWLGEAYAGFVLHKGGAFGITYPQKTLGINYCNSLTLLHRELPGVKACYFWLQSALFQLEGLIMEAAILLNSQSVVTLSESQRRRLWRLMSV